MRRLFLSCFYALLVWGMIGISWARAASPAEADTHRSPVLAYFVAVFSTLFILVIAGLPSRKES